MVFCIFWQHAVKHSEVCYCDLHFVCVLAVKMPSRHDTLQWLGDDVTSLSGRVADILKLDAGVAASPASSTTALQSLNSRYDAEELRHPEAAFSDSFSRASERDELSQAQRPTVDVDVVTDAVGKLTVASETEPVTPVAAAEPGDTDAMASTDAATAGDDAVATGAVGGRSSDGLLSMLAQFADETVRQ